MGKDGFGIEKRGKGNALSRTLRLSPSAAAAGAGRAAARIVVVRWKRTRRFIFVVWFGLGMSWLGGVLVLGIDLFACLVVKVVLISERSKGHII